MAERDIAEAQGEFKVTRMAGEDPVGETPAAQLTHAHGEQAFSGGIDGTGQIDWLLCYRSNRTADFVGLQRIDGTIDGRTGAFVLRSIGAHDGTASSGTWTIVDGSGSDGLESISGDGDWTAGPGPNGTYRLRYRLG